MDKLVIPKVSFDNIVMPKIAVQAGGGVQEIQVEWDKAYGVIVNPSSVAKGTTVRFKDPSGGKLRIAFLSPGGKEILSVSDSEEYALTVGGVYHFKCFFTPLGAKHEISPPDGGVIEVLPQRP